jgi:hypothetical protein
MARIVLTRFLILLLAAATVAVAQEEDVFLLDELSIEGQVREPSVAIFSTRILPEIEAFKLEKSFFDQARSPDEQLVELDPDMGNAARVQDPQAMLGRERVRNGYTPAQKVAGVSTDEEQGSVKENVNDPAKAE